MEEEGDEGSEKVSKMRGREGKRRQGEENRQGDGRSGGRKVADREREGTAKCICKVMHMYNSILSLSTDISV